MTNSQDDSEIEPEADAAAAQTGSRRSRWPLFILLVLVGAVAFAGWEFYPQYEPRLSQLIAGFKGESEPAGRPETAIRQTPMRETAPQDAAPVADIVVAPVVAAPVVADSVVGAPAAAPVTVARAQDIDRAIASLTDGLAALSVEVDRLNAHVAAMTGQVAADVAASRQVSQAQLESDGALVSLAESVTRLSDGVVALSARVTELEAVGPLAGAGGKISYALGLRELDRAMSGSGPFATELEAISQIVGNDPAIAELAQHAAGGLTSRETLRLGFTASAAAAVRAQGSDPEGDWLAQMVHSARSLVMVRSTGEQAGTGVAAIVARAEARLATGDLAAAVRELAALEGAPAEAVSGWLTDANARLAAERALAALTVRLSQAIADDKG